MTADILVGDSLERLKTLPDATVNTCVTSPPYYGLRQYLPDGSDLKSFEIGLEETPEQYINKLVAVFREVRRVLRDDGTCFINIGDSYSNGGMANITDILHSALKECLVFGLNTLPVAQTAQSVNVPSLDKRPKNGELAELLCPQRESVKDGNNDFLQILDSLTIPRNGRGCGTETTMMGNNPTTDILCDISDGSGIVVSNLDSDLQTELTILFSAATGAGEKNDATLTIKKTGEPRTKSGILWHSDWEPFFNATIGKRIPDINLVDNPISFGNGFLSFACDFSDFIITKASDKQITLSGINGRITLTINAVRHLRFILSDGSVVPYTTLYNNAIKKTNKYAAKNELLIPFRLADALQEDGWICRQTIIWAKPNPMPESVKDRCTKSHEYIFLLSKSKQYYYDSEAIKEPSESGIIRTRQRPNGVGTDEEKAGDFGFTSCGIGDFRNKRDVWTVTTKPYTEAHFAVFPPDLIEPCILAGAPFDGLVLDPFTGSGTTAVTALQNGRNFIGVELNPKYVTMAEKRIKKQGHYQERIGLEG